MVIDNTLLSANPSDVVYVVQFVPSNLLTPPSYVPNHLFPSESIVIGRGHQELTDLLKTFLKKGDWILVKGSRGMGMEKVVKNLSRKNARYHQSDKYQGVDG